MGALPLALVLSLRKARTHHTGDRGDPQHGGGGPASSAPSRGVQGPSRPEGAGFPFTSVSSPTGTAQGSPLGVRVAVFGAVVSLLRSILRGSHAVSAIGVPCVSVTRTMSQLRPRHPVGPASGGGGHVCRPSPEGRDSKLLPEGQGRRGQDTHQSYLRPGDRGGRAPSSSASSQPRPCLGAPVPSGEAPWPGPATAPAWHGHLGERAPMAPSTGAVRPPLPQGKACAVEKGGFG